MKFLFNTKKNKFTKICIKIYKSLKSNKLLIDYHKRFIEEIFSSTKIPQILIIILSNERLSIYCWKYYRSYLYCIHIFLYLYYRYVRKWFSQIKKKNRNSTTNNMTLTFEARAQTLKIVQGQKRNSIAVLRYI